MFVNSRFAVFFILLLMFAFQSLAMAQKTPIYDFSDKQVLSQWGEAHDIAGIRQVPEGMEIGISGEDPYLFGPAADYPAEELLWLKIRLKSEQGGNGQIFWFEKNPSESASIHFFCRAEVWEEIRVPLPALGRGFRLRLDPPGTSGKCFVSKISFESRTLFKEPEWVAPDKPSPPDQNFAVTSGDLKLVVASAQLNDFEVRIGGREFAIGYTHAPIGVFRNGKAVWLNDLFEKMLFSKAKRDGAAIVSQLKLGEPGGNVWELNQRYSPAKTPGAIDVELQWTVSQDQEILFLPTLTLFPGAGSFGAKKDHALFAGLEYLDSQDTGSSEADIRGPGSHRLVPDNLRVTIPLMALEFEGRYLAISWLQSPAVAPMFDLPDRHFRSGGSLMGLIFPGSDGANRQEGELLPYAPVRLKAGIPLLLKATIYGGMGKGVVPSIKQYIAQNGLPALPKTGLDSEKYYSLATAGWLDSGLSDKAGKFRHALPGSFGFGAAPDAAMMLDWLSQKTKRPELKLRLLKASKQALALVPSEDLNFRGVSHVRYPVPALLYGHLEENLNRSEAEARGALKRFESDGTIIFKKNPKGEDLGATHFEAHANGLSAPIIASQLENASLSGSEELISEGLKILRLQDQYENSAPRGAQTWEVPLHTPDILASAYLVKAYTLGYALSGDKHFLEQAQKWAWTGIPFLYLTPPNIEKVDGEYTGVAPKIPATKIDRAGVYSSIAVFGATQWTAPNWMGLPVQWCGLVYSDALYRLFKYDPNPIWKQIADGITLSGIQQTFPIGKDSLRQGLLPDSFNLRPQSQNDPGINPGTVQANAIRQLTGVPLYDMQVFFAKDRLIVHAPGSILPGSSTQNRLSFKAIPWTRSEYDLLIVGFKKEPTIKIDDKVFKLAAPSYFDVGKGRLILHLKGEKTVQIDL